MIKKVVKTETINYDDGKFQSRRAEVSEFDERDRLVSSAIIEYDERGHIISNFTNELNSDGRTISTIVKYFGYNKRGKLVHESMNVFDEIHPVRGEVKNYDKRGKLESRWVVSYRSTNFIFEYEASVDVYDADGKFLSTSKFMTKDTIG